MNVGDKIKCIDGDFEGFTGIIVDINYQKDRIYFKCSDCPDTHGTYLGNVLIIKNKRSGHHLTKIFK